VDTPRVTVVIPTYNMEQHIGATLDSLQRQTYAPFEAIVVDDCSTDGTADIVKARAELDPRIRYVKLDANSNRPAVPRNRGLALARTEYVAFLDHDDLWTEAKLERQVRVLDKYPDVGLVHSYLWEFTGRSRLRGLVYLPDPFRRRASSETFNERNVVQCSSAMVRTSILVRAGGFDERAELRTVEDYELWRRLSRRHRVVYVSEVHGFYRHSSTGASGQDNWVARHTYLDEVMGTRVLENRPSEARRIFRRILGFPAAVYFHLLEGSIRIRMGWEPRIW